MNLRQGPLWLFFRKHENSKELFFYPVCCDIPDDKTDEEALIANVECNDGTVKVEDTEGNILWQITVN